MSHDVVIVGGGPAGLSAALALGRAGKRVLLCDAGARRNAAAVHVQNFVTRDGTAPDDFRRIAREQLAAYPSVAVRDERVESIAGARGAFVVELVSGSVAARRVLLCTGMVDEVPAVAGFRELWGRAIFQCPYCHGWEVRGRRWGYLAPAADVDALLPFALRLPSWSPEVTVFTGGFELPGAMASRLADAGIRLATAPVRRLVANDGRLEAVELADGTAVPCDVLFAHPEQRQVEMVQGLSLQLDGAYVRVDPMKRETSIPGIYAAGDLTTRMQAAVIAAAAGMQAATMIHVDLAFDARAAAGP